LLAVLLAACCLLLLLLLRLDCPPVRPAAVPVAVVTTAGDAALNTFKALSAGAFAGALSRTITSPLERLKVLKQVQSSSHKYDGIVRALVRMYQEEGLRSYWKGNGTNVVRIAPFSAIQFVSFDIYKGVSQHAHTQTHDDDETRARLPVGLRCCLCTRIPRLDLNPQIATVATAESRSSRSRCREDDQIFALQRRRFTLLPSSPYSLCASVHRTGTDSACFHSRCPFVPCLHPLFS
jgi:hypothetical protein